MNKLKTFTHIFRNSITSTSYYKQVIKAPLFFSVKYLILLLYFVFLIQSIIFAIQAVTLLPKLPEAMNVLQKRLEDLYPRDLVLTVEKGKLSTNKQEPFHIDIPELKDLEDFEHLVTFDTKAIVDDYPNYETIFLVTDDGIVYPDSERAELDTYRVSKFAQTDDNISFTRNDYDGLLERISPVIDWVPRVAPLLILTGVLLFPLFSALITTVWNLLGIAILTVLVWIISNLFKNKLTYKNVFQMGIHGATIPVLLTAILGLAGVSIPWLFTSSFIFFMVIVLSRFNEVKT